MLQLQHGDVLLQQVEELPKDAIKRQFNGILVEGEHTGHAHRVATETTEIWELNGQIYLDVSAPTPITHEEHRAFEIPAGIYQVGRVKEYDYLREMKRNVID